MKDRKKDEQEAPKRRPYVPPAVASEDVFETMALSCAKDGPLACHPAAPNKS